MEVEKILAMMFIFGSFAIILRLAFSVINLIENIAEERLLKNRNINFLRREMYNVKPTESNEVKDIIEFPDKNLRRQENERS